MVWGSNRLTFEQQVNKLANSQFDTAPQELYI